MGVMETVAAIRLAQEKGLDLIEITATVQPPIAKIMSFDKFRYQKEKEFKKQRVGQKTTEWKQIQISVREAKNDMARKAKQAEEFLAKGHVVEIMVTLRGREKAHRELAMDKIKEFFQMITAEYKISSEPKYGGRGVIGQIMKK